MPNKTAIIIGAGPAGLTAAYELITRTDIHPVVLEKSTYMGGISRTINHGGNRMDLGGHRFFSKSDRVMNWWFSHLPVEANGQWHASAEASGSGRGAAVPAEVARPSPSGTPGLAVETAPETDTVMLVRQRKSRIYFLRRFFDYPIQLSPDTLRKLGFRRAMKIGFSYLRSMLFPIQPVENLEQFFINRFGRELYLTFFKSYTEKVWGVPCERISAEWGAQRIKGLSIWKAIGHFLKQAGKRKGERDIVQKEMETSLIEQFLYPKFGPGQMWEEVARKIRERGGEILTEFNVRGIEAEAGRILAVRGTDAEGNERTLEGDFFFSTMPVQELVGALSGVDVPQNVREIAAGLQYRDFIAVGLLVDGLQIKDESSPHGGLVKDNWIYIQEPEVQVGRLQIFNNWSPYLVADPAKIWIGAEYFCYLNDPLWKLTDREMAQFAIAELDQINIIKREDVLDFTVARMEKTYPAYFGSYERFEEIRQYTDSFPNLFLVGRNGQHRYNNQDHSMLTAMIAVDNILAGVADKSNVWAVNTESDYHESK